MFKKLMLRQVHRIARLAETARKARDMLLRGVPEEVLAEPRPARGERDLTEAAGFELLPEDHPALTALRRAIEGLGPLARSELFTVMRIGQGDLAPGGWQRGLSEAATLGDERIGAILAEDIDLQVHLEKGLSELRLT